MTPEDVHRGASPKTNRSRKHKPHTARRAKESPDGKKSPKRSFVPGPECRLIGGQGSCPEWEELLVQYPMIDSVQREDFPDHGASFAYLAHFYRTAQTAEESARAQKEFEDFFRAIGYRYNSSGNFESRWFEGIGVQIR